MLPAIAVGEALRERGAAVTFAGSPDRVEARLVPEAGFELDSFRISGLPRRPSVELVRSMLRAGGAVRESRRILKRRQPDVVLGAGSFVAGPMVLAAASMRIPTALTEADAHLGLANRLAAPFAERVFLSYELDGRGPPKYLVVGRPIPSGSRALPQAEARERLGLPADGGRILGVFGARAGAKSLNDFAVKTWGESGPVVFHLSGERDYGELQPLVRRADYHLLPMVEDFGAALSAVDLALARSGGTVWELAAAGLPAVLVPYPHATADHQAKNARYFERGGGAVVVPEARLDEARAVVESLVTDDARLRQMSDAMRGLAKEDAADRIAEEVLELAAARR
ncbi:MAG TPA: UDP-N-acetylglucosamine--N-acetylmuramyl-(pentapeptide) pyrophosphoryl-undecaprenol N-acetylglucosamine transferase [Gaiellaceae bacterium]|nr:UDP-N-acetylglucosamine--N-acetylmuramyl-(pentapeptide) pyrophosphoryl-undecaprenol N-acetylglucosamine transferase [Gaiellaceae bacterium]